MPVTGLEGAEALPGLNGDGCDLMPEKAVLDEVVDGEVLENVDALPVA